SLEGRASISYPVAGHTPSSDPIVFEAVHLHLVGCAVEPGLDDAVMLQDQLAVRRARAAGLRIVLPDVPEAVHEQTLGEPGPLDLVEPLELRGEEIRLVNRALAGG